MVMSMGGGGQAGSGMNIILAIVLGGIAAMVQIAIFPTQQVATDRFYLQFVEHCTYNNEAFNKVFLVANDATRASGTQYLVSADANGKCESANGPAGAFTGKVVTEHGFELGKVNNLTLLSTKPVIAATCAAQPADCAVKVDGTWKPVPSVLQVYGGLSRLVLEIFPVVTATGFLGITAFNLLRYARGSVNIGDVIITSIVALLATVVMMSIGPPIMDYLQEAYDLTSANILTVMTDFGSLLTLVMGFSPVVFCASLLGWMGWVGSRAAQDFM